MKELWNSINKFYLSNVMLVAAIICSVVFMFVVQFEVEALRGRISKAERKITAYEDKIKLLEVEWVYLTRPERLRNLASIYLKDNDYTLASQIKGTKKLKKYYLAVYKKTESKQLALNVKSHDLKRVSF